MSSQAAAFLASAAFGAVLGIFFDIFRVLRRLFRHKTAATAAQDALFWVASTIVLFLLLLHLNNGEIRGYLFLGLLLGAIIYNMTLSRYFIALMLVFLRAVFAAIYMPIRLVGRFCKNTTDAVKKGLKSGAGYVKIKSRKLHSRIKWGHDESKYADRHKKNETKTQSRRKSRGRV